MLGPLEVRAGSGELLEVGGARLRTLLIMLALRPGQLVPASQLIDGLWAEQSPSGAPNALQALVSRLRRALPEAVIEAGPSGYRLAIRPLDTDIVRFEELTEPPPTSPDLFTAPHTNLRAELTSFVGRDAELAEVAGLLGAHRLLTLTGPGGAGALDGMPLAIELAAARLRTMAPEQVAARLDDRFGLLTGGSRVAMPRHQTLRAVVDWSWDLLDEPERAVWRRFSLFAGGATLEAAEQVCAGSGIRADQVLDLLSALADKSLLTVRQGQEGPRYRMLEIIRAYGQERLAEAGEREEVRQEHARYFTRLAAASQDHLHGAHQLEWLGRLAADQDVRAGRAANHRHADA